MKYIGGKSCYDTDEQKWIYRPRVYTDFYCSMAEWSNLGKGKDNFIYQVRSAIVDLFGMKASERSERDENGKIIYTDKMKLKNGLIINRLSFDRTGRRDGLETEKYSADIIKYAIKLITHRDAEVEFFSWKGTIDHIEISFTGTVMPNIIILVDEYGISSTNRTLKDCIDAIYDTLKIKIHENYERYYAKYFNKDYDIIYYKSLEDANCDYSWARDLWIWKDCFFTKKNRRYNRYGSLTYTDKL